MTTSYPEWQKVAREAYAVQQNMEKIAKDHKQAETDARESVLLKQILAQAGIEADPINGYWEQDGYKFRYFYHYNYGGHCIGIWHETTDKDSRYFSSQHVSGEVHNSGEHTAQLVPGVVDRVARQVGYSLSYIDAWLEEGKNASPIVEEPARREEEILQGLADLLRPYLQEY